MTKSTGRFRVRRSPRNSESQVQELRRLLSVLPMSSWSHTMQRLAAPLKPRVLRGKGNAVETKGNGQKPNKRNDELFCDIRGMDEAKWRIR